jgi:hypothetical protein
VLVPHCAICESIIDIGRIRKQTRHPALESLLVAAGRGRPCRERMPTKSVAVAKGGVRHEPACELEGISQGGRVELPDRAVYCGV